MQTADTDAEDAPEDGVSARLKWDEQWRLRILVVVIVVLGVATIWATNRWLTERFTEATRARAEMRSALYTGNLLSELQRNAVVPQLLVRDPTLVSSLTDGDYSSTSARLIAAQKEIEATSILLLDASGRVVGATQRSLIGTNFSSQPFYIDALRQRDTVFTVAPDSGAGFTFSHSRPVVGEGGTTLGVIVVAGDFARLERSWAGISDAVAVLDSEGRIILATEPRWRGLTLPEALTVRSAPSAILRAFQVTADWTSTPADAYVQGKAVMQTNTKVGFRGWRMITFTTYESVRQQVNVILALETMAFAILLAAGFWLTSRRALDRSERALRESADLRALNARLTAEIAERERVQRELRVAELTVQQSSKLAALGEMSAGVSHELNQPLAAMKTYLAGARLLVQRDRKQEALSSFQRIDSLIGRMTAITRQLKSFARKGGEAFEAFDLRTAVSEALTLVEPQMRARRVRVSRVVPRDAVMVFCDRIRLEQVVINLLTNAVDAVQSAENPQIEISIRSGAHAILSVRDNGHGIADLDKLFEPFFTTKEPGEGTGLGLAISSEIIADFDGRLTAHNNERGPGAVFEVQLPLHAARSTGRALGRQPEPARRTASQQ